MDIDLTNLIGDNNDNENSETGHSLETVERGTALLMLSHAMTDYMLHSEDTLRAFLAFVSSRDDEIADDEIATLRENMDVAHDAFAGMAARSQAQLAMAQFLSGMSSI
jgi:hypothetical protein